MPRSFFTPVADVKQTTKMESSPEKETTEVLIGSKRSSEEGDPLGAVAVQRAKTEDVVDLSGLHTPVCFESSFTYTQ